jgi:3-hydroxyisobutyrate dehydrogenase
MVDHDVGVGFIGLGAMGMPMARHLVTKLPSETHIYVFDIAQALVEQLCAEFPSKVFKCANAKDAAEKTVRHTIHSLETPH